MGSFDGLQVALSSLYAQRRGLDVTGQNVANANTEGYSRQRVVMASVGGNTVPAIHSTWNGSSGGVTVSEVTRMRDAFMDIQGRAAHASLAQAGVAQEALGQVEQVINEPSDTGLSAALGDLWAGFDDVGNNPGNEAARSQLLQRAAGVADWLNASASSFGDQWAVGRTQLDSLVSEANTAAAGIAELNGAIKRATAGGLPSNELADQRDQLAMKISELTGATTRVGEDGSLDVYLGGTSFVRGSTADQLTTSKTPIDLAGSATETVTVSWVDKSPVSDLGGQSAGLLQVLNVTLPGYASRLDDVAVSIATAVNDQQLKGYDLNGSVGTAMFSGTTAASFAVAFTNPRLVAAAGSPPTVLADGSVVPSLDARNADAMASIASRVKGPDADYRKLVVDLGVAAQSANRRVDVQTSVTADVDGARDAAAGVNIDEEMVNMLSFQRAYEAAGRVLTSVDSMLDTLINRTGLVGR